MQIAPETTTPSIVNKQAVTEVIEKESMGKEIRNWWVGEMVTLSQA